MGCLRKYCSKWRTESKANLLFLWGTFFFNCQVLKLTGKYRLEIWIKFFKFYSQSA